MASTIILSDNGASSGSAGVKTTGGDDGKLILQTTTSGGTATNAVYIDTSQNVGIGTSSPTRKLDVAGTWSNTGDYLMNSASPQLAWASGDLRFYSGGLSGVGTQQAAITAAGVLQFNSGYGSVATAYGCRAWVNFNGTGTVAIRASGNVSSITDNGTGDYTVNFTNAMPDANYALGGAVFWEAGIPSGLIGVGGTAPASSSCKIITLTNNSDTARDFTQVYVAFHR